MTDQFTVRLSRYSHTETYDRKVFTIMFPESMITAALTDPEETEIDINEPIVTPYVLSYLNDVTQGFIPEVPSIDMTQASRYLLIPLLGVISDPMYAQFRMKYPELNLAESEELNGHYGPILEYSLRYRYPMLLQYLWEEEDIAKHQPENLNGLYIAAYMNNLPAFRRLVGNVQDPTQSMDLSPFDTLTGFDRELLPWTVPIRMNVAEAAVYGRSNEVLAYITSLPQFKDEQWSIALDNLAISNNLVGIDLVVPLVPRDEIDIMLDEPDPGWTWEVVGHLLPMEGKDITPENALDVLIRSDWIISLGVLSALPDDVALGVIGKAIEEGAVSLQVLQDIIFLKIEDPDFIKGLYEAAKNHGDFRELLTFRDHVPNIIDPNQIWTDILTGISLEDAADLYDYIAGLDIPTMLEHAKRVGRQDLVDWIMAHPVVE